MELPGPGESSEEDDDQEDTDSDEDDEGEMLFDEDIGDDDDSPAGSLPGSDDKEGGDAKGRGGNKRQKREAPVFAFAEEYEHLLGDEAPSSVEKAKTLGHDRPNRSGEEAMQKKGLARGRGRGHGRGGRTGSTGAATSMSSRGRRGRGGLSGSRRT